MGTGPLSWAKIARGERWLYSPKLAAWQKKIINDMKKRVPQEKDLLWILSSGTQSVDEVKAIGVTHQAVLASAAAVNRHLQVRAHDRWLLNLPTYHVGGLGILARAHLSGSQVSVQKRWDAEKFVDLVGQDKVTLCSLVPTQIHDVVKASLKCPASLRAIVVGGGALDPSLYLSARRLGWPLLPSYGLTETCSQIATATLRSLSRRDFPALEVLSHAEVELREQRIFVRAKSLCRYVARGNKNSLFTIENPLRAGWLPTEDLGEWRRHGLRVLGRRDDVVKILGTLVPVNQVEHEARAFFKKAGLEADLTVVVVAGGREGHSLVLVIDSAQSLKEWELQLLNYNTKAPGPLRLRQLVWIPQIPRGELGKVKRAALLAELRLC